MVVFNCYLTSSLVSETCSAQHIYFHNPDVELFLWTSAWCFYHNIADADMFLWNCAWCFGFSTMLVDPKLFLSTLLHSLKLTAVCSISPQRCFLRRASFWGPRQTRLLLGAMPAPSISLLSSSRARWDSCHCMCHRVQKASISTVETFLVARSFTKWN